MTKISMLKLSLIAAVLTLASTATLNAQTPAHQAQIKVPFAFEVGSQHCAPGTYTVGMLGHLTLAVRGTGNGGFASMKFEGNGKAIAGNKVVFRRVGSQYFLAQVWTAGSSEHLTAYETKAEKQAQKTELAANRPAEAVEIALAQGGR